MRMDKATIYGLAFWVLLIGGGGGAWWLHDVHQSAQEKASGLKISTGKEQARKKLDEFARHLDALVGWENAVPKRGEDTGGNLSIDFSRVLIRTNGQPVLFSGRLND